MKLETQGSGSEGLLDLLGEARWIICVDITSENEEAKMLYKGIGETIIYYILAKGRIRELMVRLEVGHEICSEKRKK